MLRKKKKKDGGGKDARATLRAVTAEHYRHRHHRSLSVATEEKKTFSEQGSWKVIPLHENNRPYLALSIPKDIMEL